MIACPKGCSRRATRHWNGALTFVGADAFGFAEHKQAVPVPVPAAMRDAFADMVRRTNLRPPVLEFYDDLHGVGGLFLGDHWAIAVGMRDMRDIAARVLATWRPQVMNVFANRNARYPNEAELQRFAVDAATRRCMAHELGHAMISAGHPNPYPSDGEAGADYYAGKFDAACGRDAELGQYFFHTIGCVGPSCDHPSPPARAAAYWRGYSDQQRAA